MKNTYNKIEPEPVRIGNWVEESALHDMTGEHRYTSWAPKEDGPSLYATRARKPEKEDTFRRTILHTAYLTPDPGTIPDITHARPVTSPRKGRPAPPVSTSDRPLAIPPEVDPWATTNRTDFADPLVQGRGTWLPETVYGQKDLPRGVGVRAALRQRALQERAMAEACAVAEDPAEELTTTHRETFKEHDLKGMVVGKRRDKDR